MAYRVKRCEPGGGRSGAGRSTERDEVEPTSTDPESAPRAVRRLRDSGEVVRKSSSTTGRLEERAERVRSRLAEDPSMTREPRVRRGSLPREAEALAEGDTTTALPGSLPSSRSRRVSLVRTSSSARRARGARGRSTPSRSRPRSRAPRAGRGCAGARRKHRPPAGRSVSARHVPSRRRPQHACADQHGVGHAPAGDP